MWIWHTRRRCLRVWGCLSGEFTLYRLRAELRKQPNGPGDFKGAESLWFMGEGQPLRSGAERGWQSPAGRSELRGDTCCLAGKRSLAGSWASAATQARSCSGKVLNEGHVPRSTPSRHSIFSRNTDPMRAAPSPSSSRVAIRTDPLLSVQQDTMVLEVKPARFGWRIEQGCYDGSKRTSCPQRRTTMHLTIHRGTHEIGGTCIELATAATHIVLDAGLPSSPPRVSRSMSGPSAARRPPNSLPTGFCPRSPVCLRGSLAPMHSCSLTSTSTTPACSRTSSRRYPLS